MTDDNPVRSADAFAALHHADRPLLLPNAWDHASALLLHAHGFPAVGTTSLGVAAAAGLPDGTRATREETLRLAGVLGTLPCPLSVDAEDGFSDDPGEVGAFAAELQARGVVGINLEDGLGPVDRHVAKIEAVRAAAPGLFVNARTDTYWLGDGEGTLDRVLAYRDAGADGVFVPGLTDPDAVAGLVRALDGCPLNVLYATGGPTLARLADAGVRRVSLGSLLYRRALGAALDAVVAVRDGRPTGEGTVPTYQEVQGLAG
ncbi:isocitrate lyase/phosphoenolpyruvate mutase family protein [Streptomyces sp. NPDC096538]|uniref:isocitrate lyase/PEP mutase family protein n=1 Tax=Streptomyces sp. NPDC096538 TaxID=3155427 RepID=UPI00331EC78B